MASSAPYRISKSDSFASSMSCDSVSREISEESEAGSVSSSDCRHWSRSVSLTKTELGSFSSWDSHESHNDTFTETECARPVEGFLKGSVKDLETYVRDIVDRPRDSGIYVWDKITPTVSKCVSHYREGQEFQAVRSLRNSEHSVVILCRDVRTRRLFIRKRIPRSCHRLAGLEFLTSHSQDFLPEMYGVYNEKGSIWICQEYVEGNVLDCNWSLAEVRQLGERLMTICQYLHQHDLALCNIKLKNVRVRQRSDPHSLVILSFSSAKHPQYYFQNGGYTFTYLPPWYRDIESLQAYHPLLKTADLWASACVLISLLMTSPPQGRHLLIWGKQLETCRQSCESGCPGQSFCYRCKQRFLTSLQTHGKRILEVHLGDQMAAHAADPDWLALQKLLEYLTDCSNVGDKSAQAALTIIREATC